MKIAIGLTEMEAKLDGYTRAVDLALMAALGSGTIVQELAASVVSDVERMEADLVIEETLCLVATAGARALMFGLESDEGLRSTLVSGLLGLPYLYRDYLLGRAVLEGSAEKGDAVAEQIAARLARKMDFYEAHLPEASFPSERKIEHVMELWMGRISPPRLEELPSARLKRLALVERLNTHVQLLLAYVSQ